METNKVGRPVSGRSLYTEYTVYRYTYLHKKKRFLAPMEGNQYEHPHQHYHPTHTQDLRLFRCELSKVA